MVDSRFPSQVPDIILKPYHVYYTKDKLPVLEPDAFKKQFMDLPRKILFASSWNEFLSLLKYKPKSVCVNAAHFKNQPFIEVLSMVETFSRLINPDNKISISIAVNDDTPYELIKQAQKSQVIGIVPNPEFGWQETIRGLAAQFSGNAYWPKNVIDQLPGAKKPTVEKRHIKLTTRQQQIFEIIVTRGCSNKQVAKLLDISESTVKLHVGCIFKKYGVKNRTQLAVFSKVSEK